MKVTGKIIEFEHFLIVEFPDTCCPIGITFNGGDNFCYRGEEESALNIGLRKNGKQMSVIKIDLTMNEDIEYYYDGNVRLFGNDIDLKDVCVDSYFSGDYFIMNYNYFDSIKISNLTNTVELEFDLDKLKDKLTS